MMSYTAAAVARVVCPKRKHVEPNSLLWIIVRFIPCCSLANCQPVGEKRLQQHTHVRVNWTTVTANVRCFSFSPHGVFKIRISIGHPKDASKSSGLGNFDDFWLRSSKVTFMSSGGY